MALTTDGIFEIEATLREIADGIRKDWPADLASSPEAKAHAAIMQARAKRVDAGANLLFGLQGVWEHHGGAELVRDGFKRMSRPFDKSKTFVLAVEEKAAEPKADAEPAEAAA